RGPPSGRAARVLPLALGRLPPAAVRPPPAPGSEHRPSRRVSGHLPPRLREPAPGAHDRAPRLPALPRTEGHTPMISNLAGLAVLGLAGLLILLGTRLPGLAAPSDGALQRLVTGALAGMVLFHLLATLLDLTGLGWSALKLGAGLLIL